MSLIGERAAVVSLGTSCQTARHVSLNVTLLRARLDPTMQLRTLPFDWCLAPPGAVARWLRGPVRVPPTLAELVPAKRPFWARQGVWLWHDPVEEAADFTALAGRLQRRWARMLALRALERRVFILSNTQNNLDRVRDGAPQTLDFRLTAQRMRDVAAAVASVFGPDGNSLLFVAYADRLTPDARLAGFPLAILEPDASDHDGDAAQWRAVLERQVAA
ncbi:hypothetical protein [Falsiroseomonas selenitidurans]|uniref:Uncharacterized protein n=1 Tax=Falsiroseomonas selenitidurans TaxID=2716335 RepID=A0ABX1DYJ6_9PROT|nr:hypothetical protein [Falsiroseomonas selenitidurans]NKC29460.1 hypothetical protein [Falsiroseomonas selenitidurans]